MTVLDVCKLLDCQLICGEDNFGDEVLTACGSDMMSDVLAYVKDQSVLLTGLVNSQVVRTADMMDMSCIVFVRGKVPSEDMISLAEQRGIALMTTQHRMFPACGLLWEHGLRGGDSQ
ncbi:MAG: DRTGG domain-containing protein [Eubacteriales bacterium]